jgi:hypothetical protein
MCPYLVVGKVVVYHLELFVDPLIIAVLNAAVDWLAVFNIWEFLVPGAGFGIETTLPD